MCSTPIFLSKLRYLWMQLISLASFIIPFFAGLKYLLGNSGIGGAVGSLLLYGFISVIGIFSICKLKLNFNNTYLKFVVSYLALVALGLIINGFDKAFSEWSKEAVFIILPFIVFINKPKLKESLVEVVAIGILSAYYLTTLILVIQGKRTLGFFLSYESLLKGDTIGFTFHTIVFTFPLFLIYFYQAKRIGFFISFFISLILANLRIATFGFLLAFLCMVFLKSFLEKKKVRQGIVLFIFCITLFIALNFDTFIDVFLPLIFTSDSNKFTSGRYNFFKLAKDEVLSRMSFLQILFGNGCAYSTEFSMFNFKGIQLLHNDYLKIFIDYGLSGFFLFGYLLYQLSSYSYLCSVLVVYQLTLFMSDNTLIYTPYVLCFLFFINIFESKGNSVKNNKKN